VDLLIDRVVRCMKLLSCIFVVLYSCGTVALLICVVVEVYSRGFVYVRRC